jgi:hypothetical protein
VNGAGNDPKTAWRHLLDRDPSRRAVPDLRRRFSGVEEHRLDLGVYAGPGRRAEPGYRSVPYKEAFSPGLVRAILDTWTEVNGPLLDPFSGVGTSLLVAGERGLPSCGVELMPYSCWATSVLVRAHQASAERLRDLATRAATRASGRKRPLPNRVLAAPAAAWALQPDVLQFLSALQRALPARGSDVEADLLHLALLSVVETVSQSVKDGTSLRHRAARREGRSARPGRKDQRLGKGEVIETYLNAVSDICDDLPKMPAAAEALVVRGDARRLPFRGAVFGAAVFSPPYPNRYDYSAIYQLELAFGEFVRSEAELRGLRKQLLRSHLEAPPADAPALDDPAVLHVLRSVADAAAGWPSERGRTLRMLVGYFDDMHRVLAELARVLKPGSPVACVVGTQTYFGCPVPTDLMLASLAERHDLAVDGLWVLRHKRVAVQQRHRGAEGGGRETVVFLRRR